MRYVCGTHNSLLIALFACALAQPSCIVFNNGTDEASVSPTPTDQFLEEHEGEAPLVPALLAIEPGPEGRFPRTVAGQTRDRLFSIFNYGERTALIGAVSSSALGLSSPFSLVGGTCASDTELAAGERCTLLIRYAPSANGTHAGTLTLAYIDVVDSADATLSLAGRTEDADPDLDFAVTGMEAYYDPAEYFSESGVPARTYSSAGLYRPLSVFITSSNNLLVGDQDRIHRFDHSTGSYLGFTSGVWNTEGWPGGGATGCGDDTTDMLATPGWCTDVPAGLAWDDAVFGTGFIGMRPAGLWADDTYLYAAGERSLSRYDVRTGAFTGWVGRQSATGGALTPSDATGGPGGCAATVGGEQVPGWCTGGEVIGGTGTKGFNEPGQIWGNSTYLYIVEPNQSRVRRIVKATGVDAGWIGQVASNPASQGPGNPTSCAVGAGNVTPGWCIGGDSQSGAQDGALSQPNGVWGDSTYLYVLDTTNQRLNRFVLATGAFAGWSGFVDATPTGDAAGSSGCATRLNNTHTAGWCTGGTTRFWSDDALGALNSTRGITGDSQYLYIALAGTAQGAVLRYTYGGVFDGWTGVVGTSSPSANATGSTGCTGRTQGQETQAWCIGGAMGPGDDGFWSEFEQIHASGGYLYLPIHPWGRVVRIGTDGRRAGFHGARARVTGWRTTGVGGAAPDLEWAPSYPVADDLLSTIEGLSVDGTYLYAADSARHRVTRIDLSTGLSGGWIGSKGPILPTGGAAGCTDPGEATPGWCTGGNSNSVYFSSGPTYGALHMPSDIHADATHLYVADSQVYKVYKFNKTTGAPEGWIGGWGGTGAGERPTSGAAGCTTLNAGDAAPGWCVDGIGATGTPDGPEDGKFDLVGSNGIKLTSDAGYLYVLDPGNYRVQRFDLATGAFDGWIGRVLTNPAGQGTGNAVNCAVGAGNITPGWCVGGTSQQGEQTAGERVANGGLRDPRDIAIDATYLYVLDGGGIFRYVKATGAFAGWMGETIATVQPSSNAVGHPGGVGGTECATTADWGDPGGWCMGGTTGSYFTSGPEGGPDNALALAVDSGYIYITANYAALVARFDATTGTSMQLRGLVQDPPTSGGATCAITQPGELTRDWCDDGRYGRVATQSPSSPAYGTAIAADGSNLYLFSRTSWSILRIPQ